MKTLIKQLCLTAGLLSAWTMPALAVSDDLRLVGLAVHQETGREIYLGAIHVDKLVPKPDDIQNFTGPKAMEYRVVARRTSIRSLLGGMLLQAELATGQPANEATASFIDSIMRQVKGSLYAGDSFDIMLTEADEAVASLNGQELAQSNDGTVFDYLLMSWLGEKGASADFRRTLTAPDVDVTLLSVYNANEPSAERIAAVAEWTGGSEEPEAAEQVAAAAPAVPAAAEISAAQPEPISTPEIGADETPVPAVATVAALSSTPSTPAADPVAQAIEQTAPAAAEEAAPEAPAEEAEAVQLAAITPQNSPVEPDRSISDALSLTDYSQQLLEFNAMVLREVNSNIKYPRSAVRRELEGTLELDLRLSQSGELQEIVVARSSGHSSLDSAAIRAANAAFEDGFQVTINEVATTEYGTESGEVIVPVPVIFRLQ